MAAIGADTVLYADMLGFKALVGNHIEWPDGEFLSPPYVPDPELRRRYNAFMDILEAHLNQVADSGVTAAVFSDSAIIRLPIEHNYRRLASSLMRTFIEAEVPVRMGIGSGTFFSGEFATRSVGQSRINVSRFYGGAVTGAYEAESCGAKGMRILVNGVTYSAFEHEHETLSDLIPPLPVPCSPARVEVNYLYSHDFKTGHSDTLKDVVGRYRTLSGKVRLMMKAAPSSAHVHYTETLAALDRMRDRVVDRERRRLRLEG